MVLIDFIKNMFNKKTVVEVGEDEVNTTATNYRITELALFVAVDYISKSLAKSEFITTQNHKPIKEQEYFLWNYAPNNHQTKVEFVAELVSALLLKGEALVVELNHNLFVADGFSRQEYALRDDEFTSVTVRGLTLNRSFTESEVIYIKYFNADVNSLLADMCNQYAELMSSASQKFTKSDGHKGILEISQMAMNDNKFQEKYSELIQKRFKKYFNSKDAVLPLYEGFKYYEPEKNAYKTTNSEVNDIAKLRAEAISIVANAFHIPQGVLTGETDLTDVALANAIDPLAMLIEQEIVKKRYGYGEFAKGNFVVIDTTKVKHIDAISSATAVDKAIACGLITPAQAQNYCRMIPNNDKWAKAHYITKNYEEVNNNGELPE